LLSGVEEKEFILLGGEEGKINPKQPRKTQIVVEKLLQTEAVL